MTGTVTIHVHAGYRQVHLLLGVQAIAADPPYPPGQVVTAGELTMPAARFDPDRLVARCPRAAWEAWWDDPGTGGRYAAFHPQHGPLAGEHRNRWLAYPLTTGWDWDVPGEQLAVIRAVFAEAAARARADVVADALAGQDPDHRYAHINELAAARARAGGVVVGDGPWVLTWDGGDGYQLETLDDTGAALSVLDNVSYATPAPTAAVLYPWADAHAWAVPPTTANPRLADWLSQTWNSGRPAGGRPVPLGPAAALGLVRPRTDPNPAVDRALFGQWAQAVTTQLPGCTLAAHTTGTQMWANDPDQAVVLGPPGTDLAAVRGAARAVTDALGWAGPTPTNPARDLSAGALAAAATVVRAGLEYQVAAQAASSAAVGRSAAFLVALTTEMDTAAAAEAAARGLPAPNPQATRAGWAKVVAHLGAGSGGEAGQQLVDAWKAGLAAQENASGSAEPRWGGSPRPPPSPAAPVPVGCATRRCRAVRRQRGERRPTRRDRWRPLLSWPRAVNALRSTAARRTASRARVPRAQGISEEP